MLVMAAITTPRFVGRRDEQAVLERLIGASRSGQGHVVLVAGEAGIGKSRLVAEVTQAARARGHRVLVGGCISLREGSAPLAPIYEAMRGLAADTAWAELDRLLGPAGDVFAGLLPGLFEARHQSTVALPMHPVATDRLSVQLVDLMARLARDAPLILVVEDIHWTDDATLQLLTLLARNLRSAPFVLIATYRSDEIDPDHRLSTFLAELERLAHPEHVYLGRFTRGEATEQIAAIRGAEAVAGLIDDVFARSEGNPFYIEELLAAAASSTTALPLTLHAVLESRLAALSHDAQRLVGAAAVRATDSTDEQLARVTAIDETMLSAALHELLDRKIFERRRLGSTEVFGFRHALLQSAAYEELLAGERRRLHLAWAEILQQETAHAEDPFAIAELARHWEAAGDAGRALPAAISAGAAAEAAYQPAMANEQYERAVRLAQDLPAGSGVDPIDLLEKAARAAAAVGSVRAVEHAGRAIELVDAAREPVRAGLLYERLGRYRWYAADGEGALAAYHEALRLVPAQPPSAARARVTAGMAQLLMILARFEESLRYCDQALANARAVGDAATESHVTNTLGVNKAYLGDIEGGLSLLWSARDMAEQAGAVEDVGRAYANLVDVLHVAGRDQEAADLGRSTFEYHRQHGLTAVYGAGGLTYAGWALHHLARWPEALATLEQARLHAMDTNSEIMNLAVSAMIEAGRGEIAQAEAHLQIARPLIAGAIDTQLLLPFAEAEAEIALLSSRPAIALRSVTDVLERAEPLVGGNIKRYGPIYALGVRAAADIVALPESDGAAATGARDQGRRLLGAMADAHQMIEKHHPAHLRLAEPYLALCRAEHARLEQRPDPGAWAVAAELLSGLGRRYLAAYALWREAEAQLQAGAGAELASVPLNAAHQLALSMGAAPLRQSIEVLARRARIDLGPAARREEHLDTARFGLTAREIDVLRLVAAGKTNREIGDQLFISAKTASVHVSNLMAKLGASRRAEAAAIAARLGLGDGAAESGSA